MEIPFGGFLIGPAPFFLLRPLVGLSIPVSSFLLEISGDINTSLTTSVRKSRLRLVSYMKKVCPRHYGFRFLNWTLTSYAQYSIPRFRLQLQISGVHSRRIPVHLDGLLAPYIILIIFHRQLFPLHVATHSNNYLFWLGSLLQELLATMG